MKNRRIKALVITISIVFTIIVCGTLAWLMYELNASTQVSPGNFDITFKASFKDGETILCEDAVLDPKAYDTTRKVLYMNGSSVKEDTSDHYYIENFHLSLTITPFIACRVRIKLNDEWLKTITYKATGQTKTESIERSGEILFPYTLNDSWFYDDKTNYIYYKGYLKKSSVPTTYEIITGGKGTFTRNISTLKESILVTASLSALEVQANRYQEIWGIDTYPTYTSRVTPRLFLPCATSLEIRKKGNK